MNDLQLLHRRRKPRGETELKIDPKYPPERREPVSGRGGVRLLGLAVLLLAVAVLAAGGWRHYAQQRDAIAVLQQRRDFVPTVRLATIKPADEITIARLPATTLAFTSANVSARASGYIEKRYVDIGDRVTRGQLLAEITAPELDHQITQAEATLAQLHAAQLQAQANLDLAQVTWNRNDQLVRKGWFSQQQGVNDFQTLKAQEAALSVAQANVTAQQGQLQVLRQQKAYQRVIAPFDGVITQRNVDVGSLVQADATSATFMFNIVERNLIRAQVFVPQDLAFGVVPGIDAILHIPEIPGRTFPGKVTRIAKALAPGTRTLLTEVDIPNPDGTVTPGTHCIIELRIPRKIRGPVVPAEAIILNGGALEVAVVSDGIAHLRKISVARDLGTDVEAASGVAPGDQVILNPPVGLTDGARVSIGSEPVEELR
jgi:RND family efflux transporter MFP subunit